MLARWFDRNGIGQYLAPDEKAAQDPVPDEARAQLWQILAPDPNFAPPTAPPSEAFAPASIHGSKFLCRHCHKWNTMSSAGTPTPSTPANQQGSQPVLFTPPPGGTPGQSTGTGLSSNHVESLVLTAAKETAKSMNSPGQDTRDKVFRMCASSKPLSDKLAKRLAKILTKNPSLVHARATHMGQLVPDGYTPLMAAAYADHMVATKVVLEQLGSIKGETDILLETNLEGKTSLHIAADRGNLDIVHMLKPYYEQDQLPSDPASTPAGRRLATPPPVDLLGRTPLGCAVTSPNPTARKRRKELEAALFSPGDLSVFGEPKPESERAGKYEQLQIAYGIADMPGMRVIMEDAVCSSTWQINGKFYCLFGVCDGHGDRGKVSSFVAKTTPVILQKHMGATSAGESPPDWNQIWRETCLEVDEKLKEEDTPGGSTGVFCLITEDSLVVANVGDSRAILIRSPPATTGLEEGMEKMAVSDENSKEAAKSETDLVTPKAENKSPSVIALSDDHKPNLEGEQKRIENAGMKVVPITFTEDGKEVTIHKVAKTDLEQLAVSRAFGDFEYKLNNTLPPEEQAVTAVSNVRVYPRHAEADMYLVLACDGVFDVMSNENVRDFVLHQVHVRAEITDTVLPEVGDALLVESLNLGSNDNMTTVIVALSKESGKIQPTIQGKALDFASPRK